MKRLALAFLFVALVSALALAQTGTITGNTAYVPTVDVMGAHENGGRGCAGCHAPHSGGRGSGGVVTGAGVSLAYGAGNMGDNGLWGTDTSYIVNAGNLVFDGSYTVNLSGLTWSSGKLYTGVATCLSCHDGNVSRGAMMSGVSYEQAWGLLNFAGVNPRNAGPLGYATVNNGGVATLNPYPTASATLYGGQPIPTLLGNDGGTVGDYNNDHPVGPYANLGAAASSALGNGLTITFSGVNNTSFSLVVASGSKYANFVYTYGAPAIASMASNNDGIQGNIYIVCTTCHNQHVQNVFKGTPKAGGTGSLPSTAFTAKIFYVNGPYNPAAPYDPTHEPSTMRFCQECHFSWSSEAYGATNIGTAY